MRTKKLNQPDLLAIAANLLPVIGVWFLGWSAVEVFTVYAMETLVIGILTLLKMAVITLFRKTDIWYNQGTSTRVSGLFFMFFFTLHFGIFAAVQTSIFAQVANINPPGSGLLHFFFHWYDYINQDIAIMLGAFIVSYFGRDFAPFILSGKYRTTPLMFVMFQPYGRIVIQQFTVIAGSMFLSFGWGKGFILIFAAAKIFFEVFIDFNRVLDKSLDDMKKQSGPVQ